MTVEHVAISRIRTDGGTQTRAAIRKEVVDDYAAVLRAGGSLPDAVVFDDGTDLWLADGFHRREAKVQIGHSEMQVEIREGNQRDALLYSAGANDSHGLRRSNEDKRQAVRMLLADDEWSQASDRWLAEKCHVSEHTVASVRAESTAQTRSCHQKIEENGQEQDHDNGKRTGKDGKERPARSTRKPQETDAQDEPQDGEIDDDDGFPVPVKLRRVFAEAKMFPSAELVLARAAAKVKECEATRAYIQGDQAQSGEKPDRMAYSSMLFTGVKKFKDLRPSLVCKNCGGNGCETCERKGWLTHGERTNEV